MMWKFLLSVFLATATQALDFGFVQNCANTSPVISVKLQYSPTVVKPSTEYTLKGDVNFGAAFSKGDAVLYLANAATPGQPLVNITQTVNCEDYSKYTKHCPIPKMDFPLPNPLIPEMKTPGSFPFPAGKYYFKVTMSTPYACVEGNINIQT